MSRRKGESEEAYRARRKCYYQRNRKVLRERARVYASKHKKERQRYRKSWVKKNPDKIRSYMDRNKEHFAELRRRRWWKNRKVRLEKQSAWRSQNKERCLENQRRYRAANRKRLLARRRALYCQNPRKVLDQKQNQRKRLDVVYVKTLLHRGTGIPFSLFPQPMVEEKRSLVKLKRVIRKITKHERTTAKVK